MRYSDRGVIRLRPRDLRADGAYLEQRRAFEALIAGRLRVALQRRGLPVGQVRIRLGDLPEPGAQWWAIATLDDGRELPIACALRRPFVRPRVNWSLT
ncbi:hypothetical protein Q5424_00920 [Conexibacter sp. JD483]|uniref:hypothetical protein n=1 Tax=unclassified Conexibacter TaxID=2627773 RepID=UPI00271E62CB|nr:MULTISPECIES: hypothetical protein [unclassified Conexibacter]MDO8198533.1 hypothetical protein [Conexibacter sp. CPCC 205762]MDR9367619.1 hypothetical protein [Conexibacter sp. JD483]